MKRFTLFFLTLLIAVCLNNCKEEELDYKIDPSLRLEIKRLAKLNELDKELLVLLKVNEDLTDAHRVVLKKHDVSIIADIAHIHTAAIPAKSINKLAKLRFIDSIEASRDLMRRQLVDSTRTQNKSF